MNVAASTLAAWRMAIKKQTCKKGINTSFQSGCIICYKEIYQCNWVLWRNSERVPKGKILG